MYKYKQGDVIPREFTVDFNANKTEGGYQAVRLAGYTMGVLRPMKPCGSSPCECLVEFKPMDDAYPAFQEPLTDFSNYGCRWHQAKDHFKSIGRRFHSSGYATPMPKA